ncbi:MAG: hypothetical protein NC240_11120 [Clostridium sp.]|nr:hypothetical protein [Clostridium sp.]
MICKYCGNEVPGDSITCFVCGNVVEAKNNVSANRKNPKLRNEDVPEFKRLLRNNIIALVICVVLYIFMFIYWNPIITIMLAAFTIVIGMKEISYLCMMIKQGNKNSNSSMTDSMKKYAAWRTVILSEDIAVKESDQFEALFPNTMDFFMIRRFPVDVIHKFIDDENIIEMAEEEKIAIPSLVKAEGKVYIINAVCNYNDGGVNVIFYDFITKKFCSRRISDKTFPRTREKIQQWDFFQIMVTEKKNMLSVMGIYPMGHMTSLTQIVEAC